MAEYDDVLAKVTAEANATFAKLSSVVAERSKEEGSLNVLEVARQAGLEIDEAALRELQIDPIIPIHPWLPWHIWFPWRPLWCWWWHRRFHWYRCCPWWWYRCHWYPSPW